MMLKWKMMLTHINSDARYVKDLDWILVVPWLVPESSQSQTIYETESECLAVQIRQDDIL